MFFLFKLNRQYRYFMFNLSINDYQFNPIQYNQWLGDLYKKYREQFLLNDQFLKDVFEYCFNHKEKKFKDIYPDYNINQLDLPMSIKIEIKPSSLKKINKILVKKFNLKFNQKEFNQINNMFICSHTNKIELDFEEYIIRLSNHNKITHNTNIDHFIRNLKLIFTKKMIA